MGDSLSLFEVADVEQSRTLHRYHARAYQAEECNLSSSATTLRTRVSSTLIATVAWAVGMLLQFRPMLASRLGRMQSDWGDTRLNNYILEHGYRWLRGVPGHDRFWSPPIFFPARNTAAYSDVLLGVAPLYWPWRASGLLPDTSFQLWMLGVATLNFVSAWVLFRRGFRLRPLAAAAGAFLLSFAAMRTAQVMHAQLLPHFYLVLAVFALLRLFAPVPAAGRIEPHAGWVWALVAACVLQLYSSFYYAWFLAFGLFLAAPWAVALPGTRPQLVNVLRANVRSIVGSVFAGAALLVPLAMHYLAAAREVGTRSFDVVATMLPRMQSWAYLGPDSWIYGPIAAHELFRQLPMEHEQRLGLGVATATLAALGLYLGRRRRAVQILVAVPMTMALLATLWPSGFTLWRVVYAIVPGAAALRAVSRIGIAILFPASLGVALLIDEMLTRARRPIVAAAVAVSLLAMVAEQGERPNSYDKYEGRARVARITSLLGARCAAFLYTTEGGADDPWWYHADAMWASIWSGVPTLNGYSGNEPPGWPLYDIRVHSAAQDSVVHASMTQWARRWALDTATICRVSTPPG